MKCTARHDRGEQTAWWLTGDGPEPDPRCEREVGHPGAHRYKWKSGHKWHVVEFGDREARYDAEPIEGGSTPDAETTAREDG